jgi:hypothetical protein
MCRVFIQVVYTVFFLASTGEQETITKPAILLKINPNKNKLLNSIEELALKKCLIFTLQKTTV